MAFRPSATRKPIDRLAPKSAPPWENSAKRGCLCEVFGKSLAAGQLVFAASERWQFDPSFNVEEEQEDIAARIIEH